MRISATGHPELVGVGAELLFQLQAQQKARTCIFVLQHLGCLGHAEVEVTLVPRLEISEFVVGR